MNAGITDFLKNITVSELKLKRLLNEYQTEYNMTHKKWYCTKNYQKQVERSLITLKKLLQHIEQSKRVYQTVGK